jgi:hypothetical protein
MPVLRVQLSGSGPSATRPLPEKVQPRFELTVCMNFSPES